MTIHTSLAAPKVTIHDGKAITTTDDVAAYFGKQPHHVVQKVESLECSEDFIIRNFSRMIKNVQLAKGATREVVYYEMTKDGFVFLVMGFTGKKAAAFKEAYIAEFNRMEAELYAMPRHNSSAAELFTDDDLRRLTHLVWSMANGFRFEKAWTQGIWHALRLVTGVPSPQHFEVRQIPLLAEECSRIYSMTTQLKQTIFEAERQAIKRVLCQQEDANLVLGEMQWMIEDSSQQHSSVMSQALTKWQQANVSQFLQRH
ncbi:Phage regulatory protein Rha (Phage_pRha) [Sodalis glossinidius str. 'morsitans']|uniref:Phage regulatory protein Rha (Phage_pRha) n=1 Tax=Sodalis glossinidius (strain morsitans) TaxID=343509 RepID=A0A193QIN1_SODGM|nr:Rha family transcriptional regulator [Sodalis glossinidius]CRL44785.1 Phage regulatory protein Rha (Phage_pRha) [Sodalis glossinidius str. 'morsitans']